MAHDFASEEDLLDRLTAQPHDVVYLVGSAVTAPTRAGEPGVPRVDGVIEQIRRVYTRPDALERLERALAAEPSQRYQAAFRHLQRTRGQDLANAIIRRCVLQARVPSGKFPQVHQDIAEGATELCRDLERDLEGWHLPPAVRALGQLLAGNPGGRSVVLTSNFDPLVTVSVHRAGGRAFTTALHSDGGFAAIDGQGTLIVHFHGDWFRSDTLHTPAQLGQDRPRLAASLAQLLSARTLVVLGYGGWDDIFTRSLVQVIRGELASIDVLWTFYGGDADRLTSEYAGLLGNLAPGIERARVMLYKGIDAHAFLPRLAAALGLAGTAQAGHTGAPVPDAQELGSPADSILGAVPGESGLFRSGASDSGLRVGPVPSDSDPRGESGLFRAPGAGDSGLRVGPAPSDSYPGSGGAQGDSGLFRVPGPADSNPRGAGPADSGAAGGRNPFQRAGALRADASSYVRRAADDALTAALAEHPLLVVRGDFSIGKSSMLLRSDMYWARGAEAAVCRLDLMDMRIDDVNLFYDEFFGAVGAAYGQSFQGWPEIAAASQQRPLLLTIDEFSGLTEEVARRFVPALHRLGSRHAEQIRIVVTTRDPFEAVLEGFKLNNPNLGDWQTVELLPFTDAELLALLGLLPPRGRAAAIGQIEVVRRLTAMAPKPAQCLCFHLFKDELAGRSDAELAARVARKESYR